MENTFRFSALILVLLILQKANINAEQYWLNENIQSRLLTEDDECGIPPKQTLLTQPSSAVDAPKIIGGRPTVDADYPWMVLLGYLNNFNQQSWKCGGSLITSRHVLSAAHCATSTLHMARLGEYDIAADDDGDVQDIKIIQAVRHPDYNRQDGTNDIAVLHLAHDATFSVYVWPICLPVQESIQSRSFFGEQSVIAGWGRLQEGGKPSNVLQELKLPILENSECEDRFRRRGRLVSDNQFSKLVICAGDLKGGKDSCQGDSGGPMMNATQLDYIKTRYYQIGIISYGIGCARVQTPGVYTRVSEFIEWIQEMVNQ